MITDKVIVLFFKVKRFDAYFYGELKIAVPLLPCFPQKACMERRLREKARMPRSPERALPSGGPPKRKGPA